MFPYFTRIFLQHFSFGLIIPLTTMFMLEQGLSLTQVALYVTTLTVASFVFEIPTGYIADRLGRKTSVVLASLVIALAVGIFASAASLALFLVSGILEGIGFALLSGADDAFVYDTLKSKNKEGAYKRIFGIISMIDEGSTLLGMVTSTLLVLLGGMSLSIYVASGLLLLTALHSFLSLREPAVHEQMDENIAEEFEKQPKAVVKRAISLLKENKEIFLAMIGFAFLSETGRMLWQPQMSSAGFAVASFGLIFAFIKLFAMTGGYVVTKIERETTAKAIAAVGLLGAACFFIASIAQPLFVIGGIALYAFIESLYRAFKSDFLNVRASSKRRATLLSVNAMFASVLGALFTLGLGYIGDTVSLTHAFIAVGVLQIIGSLIVLSNKSRTQII